MKIFILILAALAVAVAVLVPSWVFDPSSYGDQISRHAKEHNLDLQAGGRVRTGFHLRPRPMVGVIMPRVRAHYQLGRNSLAVRADSMEVWVHPLAWIGGDRTVDLLVLRDGDIHIRGTDAPTGLLPTAAAAAAALGGGQMKGLRGLSLERIILRRDGADDLLVRSFESSGFLRSGISFPVDFDLSLDGGALDVGGRMLLRLFEEDGGSGLELSNMGLNVRHGGSAYSLFGVSARLATKGARARLQVKQLGVDDMFLNLSAEGTHSPPRLSGTVQLNGSEMGTGLGHLGLIADASPLAALRAVQLDGRMRLAGDTLHLSRISGTIDGLSLRGSMRLQPWSVRLDMKGSGDVADLGALYRPLQHIDSPMEFAVSGTVAGLDGPARSTDLSLDLEVAKPLWQPHNLERQICAAARRIQPRQSVLSQFPEFWMAQTVLEPLSARARIKDGRLNLDELRTALGNIDVRMRGDMDLPSRHYNASLELRLDQEQTSDEGCTIDVALRNRTLPVRCEGTLGRGAPSCGLDPQFLARLFAGSPDR